VSVASKFCITKKIMESPTDELLSLITETTKQLQHLQTLGIEGIQVSELQNAPAVRVKQTEASSVARDMSINFKKPTEIEITKIRAEVKPKELFVDLRPEQEKLAQSTETFEQIWAEVGHCTRCPLYQERTHIVHTEGNRKARLMFVGEAPGADEDAQARPFVGRAGQLLTKIIEAIGFKREEVLIGNVNRCRPPGNRPPTPEEASMCKPFLLREIATVQPEVIVVLGNTAMRNLLDTKIGITRLRGAFQDYKGIKVMPTFHPAYLLRDPSKKRETWEDLKKVRDYLDNSKSSS